MITITGNPLPLLALIWPLVLACVAALPPVRARAIGLLPFAPLPALWLGLSGTTGDTTVPFLLLGVDLTLTPMGALFIAMTAVIWLAAGVYAQGYMARSHRPAVFAGFWCLTLAGNLGVFLASDVVTFYVAFATVSLAAYVLIVHDATRAALRAGRVYIALVIVGEVCLLVAFVIGITAAESLGITDIRAALLDAPLGGLATVLLVAGFGVKAGMMPLHVWLPLAHPAAPTPASAVLSGAIVKAGIIGLIAFLPADSGFAVVLVVLGFAGAFGAAVLGLSRTQPKAILAYSTISQMSLVVGLVAAALTLADDGGFDRVAYYALHHGLAKAALFLSVGLVAAAGGRWRLSVLILAAVVALSVAGAPLTGGNLAKLAVKSGLEGAAEMALTLTAITTTLVLAWFLWRLSQGAPGKGRPSAWLAVPTLGLAMFALAVPWWLGSGWSGLEPGYSLRLSAILDASWPVVVGGVTAVLWIRHGLTRKPAVAGLASQLLAMRGLTVKARTWLDSFAGKTPEILPAIPAWADAVMTRLEKVAQALEARLIRQRNMSLLLVALAAAIALQVGL